MKTIPLILFFFIGITSYGQFIDKPAPRKKEYSSPTKKTIKKAIPQKNTVQNPQSSVETGLRQADRDFDHNNYSTAYSTYTKYEDELDKVQQLRLAYMYSYGKGMNKNLTRACDLYSKSISDETLAAMFGLAKCYINGEGGFSQNTETGKSWLIKSSEKGYGHATWVIGTSYIYGHSGFEQNYQTAKYYLTKAIDEQGYVFANFDLGFLYYNGLGVNKDLNKAKYLINLACDNGHLGACNFLKNAKF